MRTTEEIQNEIDSVTLCAGKSFEAYYLHRTSLYVELIATLLREQNTTGDK